MMRCRPWTHPLPVDLTGHSRARAVPEHDSLDDDVPGQITTNASRVAERAVPRQNAQLQSACAVTSLTAFAAPSETETPIERRGATMQAMHAVMALAIALYPSIASLCAQTILRAQNDHEPGIRLMNSSVHCYTADQVPAMVLAWIMVIVYLLGMPAAVVLAMHGTQRRRRAVRCQGVGAPKSDPVPPVASSSPAIHTLPPYPACVALASEYDTHHWPFHVVDFGVMLIASFGTWLQQLGGSWPLAMLVVMRVVVGLVVAVQCAVRPFRWELGQCVPYVRHGMHVVAGMVLVVSYGASTEGVTGESLSILSEVLRGVVLAAVGSR